jgi:hypothetical protein
MTKKNVRPVQSKNNYGLVRMDRTAVMYQELQKKEKTTPRPLWRRDYAK